jgi:hypothetical protein
MERDYKEADWEGCLPSEIADEIGECLVYEALQRIEEASKTERIRRNSVYQAFVNIGRVKNIWGERFDELWDDVFKNAREKLLHEDLSDAELWELAEAGRRQGELLALPEEMGGDSISYGFVAETVMPEIVGVIRYVEGVGWEIWKEQGWQRRTRERGIVGIIYYVMRVKIELWRKALGKDGNVRGAGGWLEKLWKNVSDPEWLRKVEELFLRVDFFGVPIVSNDERPTAGFRT